MITKGVAAIGSFVIGGLFTYLMHGYWHDEPVVNSSPPPQHQSAITESVRAERSPEEPVATTGREAPSGADKVPAHSFDQASTGDVPATRDESTESAGVAASKVTLQEPYGSMVAPRPSPETLTLPELFEAFSSESRDESWAYPMETGIENFSSGRAADYKAAFEYVGCQSQYCTIAGVVYGGSQADVNSMFAEMTQSGWWQAFGGHATTGSSDGEAYRFVSVFPRKPEFFQRK